MTNVRLQHKQKRNEASPQDIVRLGADELQVLQFVTDRLSIGRQNYGELRLDSDTRDFRLEALEEVIDALIYVACALVRNMRVGENRGDTRRKPGRLPSEEDAPKQLPLF